MNDLIKVERTYLEYREPAVNKAKFYDVVLLTLDTQALVLKRFGRIGANPSYSIHLDASVRECRDSAQKLIDSKKFAAGSRDSYHITIPAIAFELDTISVKQAEQFEAFVGSAQKNANNVSIKNKIQNRNAKGLKTKLVPLVVSNITPKSVEVSYYNDTNTLSMTPLFITAKCIAVELFDIVFINQAKELVSIADNLSDSDCIEPNDFFNV